MKKPNLPGCNYDARVDHFLKEVRILGLPYSVKATRLVMTEMCHEKGYKRHDESDYFIHPIAVAQTALDYGLIRQMLDTNQKEKADTLLATCLLHDIIEDVPHTDYSYIRSHFTKDIADNVNNMTHPTKEPIEDYLKRVGSSEISALVKVLDRLNNVCTLSESSNEHRERQLIETKTIYLSLLKEFRKTYWEHGEFLFQARSIMKSILAEIERNLYLVQENEQLIQQHNAYAEKIQELENTLQQTYKT